MLKRIRKLFDLLVAIDQIINDVTPRRMIDYDQNELSTCIKIMLHNLTEKIPASPNSYTK